MTNKQTNKQIHRHQPSLTILSSSSINLESWFCKGSNWLQLYPRFVSTDGTLNDELGSFWGHPKTQKCKSELLSLFHLYSFNFTFWRLTLAIWIDMICHYWTINLDQLDCFEFSYFIHQLWLVFWHRKKVYLFMLVWTLAECIRDQIVIKCKVISFTPILFVLFTPICVCVCVHVCLFCTTLTLFTFSTWRWFGFARIILICLRLITETFCCVRCFANLYVSLYVKCVCVWVEVRMRYASAVVFEWQLASEKQVLMLIYGLHLLYKWNWLEIKNKLNISTLKQIIICPLKNAIWVFFCYIIQNRSNKV